MQLTENQSSQFCVNAIYGEYVDFEICASISADVRVVSNNELCETASWNIIKGNWTYNATDCSVQNTDESPGDFLWFGTADGETPNCEYCHESFQVTIIFAVHSGEGRAGILFRTAKCSTIWAEGPSYLVRTKASKDYVQIGWLENTHWNSQKFGVNNMEFNTTNNLILVADTNLYDVYLDGNMVVDNLEMTNYINYCMVKKVRIHFSH